MTPRRRWIVRAALLALGLGWLIYAVREATGLGGHGVDGVFADGVYTAEMWGAVALVAARALLVAEDRVAWTALAAGLASWAGGDLLWLLRYDDAASVPVPSAADALYYLDYALTYAGLVLLLRARLRPLRLSLWLDGLIVGLGLSAVGAALFFQPVVDAAGGVGSLAAATTLGYPVLDLATLSVLAVAVGLTGWRPGRAWTLFGLYLLLEVLVDGTDAYREATAGAGVGGLLTTVWPGSALLLALAAWQRWPSGRSHRDGLAVIAVPGAFAFVALGVLLVAIAGDVPSLAAWLAAGALLAALARSGLTIRENARLLDASQDRALTDPLTGLGNRRALMDALDQALAPGARARESLLLFCDLDGFKHYNDSFGHAAGDALLARLGRRVRAVVAGRGAVYRLGGDEFCVLVAGPGDDHAVLSARVVEAFTDQGEGFVVHTSAGAVRLPAEAATASRALQLADERMYVDKEGRRPSARGQARDLLLRVLDEREPVLRRHVADVAELALATGRRLGLGAEELDEVARAAELHDVGKVAIPDAILHKPGPLDELEWQLMRQHTVIGERILGASPALRPIAAVVRSSHERWDGKGYPDGLAGEAIPVAARVVAVCDAYDAMVADRPYRPARSRTEALVELRAGAGSQFDPAVVAAFLPVVVGRPVDLPAPTAV